MGWIYITVQHPVRPPLPPAAGANGSSSLLTGPHNEGMSGSLVALQYSTRLIDSRYEANAEKEFKCLGLPSRCF